MTSGKKNPEGTEIEFFMSIARDLSSEDRKQLISDWMKYGRIVIDNEDGMPVAGDPDSMGVTT